jgi:hypothetical protein
MKNTHVYMSDESIKFDSPSKRQYQEIPILASPILDKLKDMSISQPSHDDKIWKLIEIEGLLTTRERGQDLEKEKQFIDQMKENDELTSDDIQLLLQNTKKQSESFGRLLQRDRKHKVFSVLSVYPHISCEEIIYALEQEDNEEDVVIKFLNPNYLGEIRQKIAMDNSSEMKQEIVEIEVEEDDDSQDSDVQFGERSKKKKQKKKPVERTYVRTKLKLDQALENKDSFVGWSPARVKAFKSIDKNPNAYFYRFNAPGETQANGAWSKEEKRLFMERMVTFDLRNTHSPQWGIFSQAIPVFYHCINLLVSCRVSVCQFLSSFNQERRNY